MIVGLFDFTKELGVFRLVDVEFVEGNLEFIEEVLGTNAEGARSGSEENDSVLGDDLLEGHFFLNEEELKKYQQNRVEREQKAQ